MGWMRLFLVRNRKPGQSLSDALSEELRIIGRELDALEARRRILTKEERKKRVILLERSRWITVVADALGLRLTHM